MGYYDDYLEHHGILGQKWGVRRFESANGHLTAAGKNRYTTDANGDYQKVKKTSSGSKVSSTGKKEGSEEEEPKKKGLTDKQKKMIIAGAAVAGTALAAYGGYKLYQLNNQAKEGLAADLHQKAVKNMVEGRKMEALGDSMVFTKDTGNALTNSRNWDVGVSYQREGGFQRHLGEDQYQRAKSKDFTLKEKYDYLKSGKTASDDSQMKMHRELIDKEREKRAGIEKHYSNLRRQQELEAQKAFKATQNSNNGGNPYAKAPSNLNPIQKAAWNASVSLANKSREKNSSSTNKVASEASKLARSVTAEGPKSFNIPSQTTARQMGIKPQSFNIPSQTFSRSSQNPSTTVKASSSQTTKRVANTVSIHGQTKFSQAAKANDDLVNELIKKNAKALSGF